MESSPKGDRNNLLPFILVTKSEVVGLIVLSYFALEWLKEHYIDHAYYGLATKGVLILCGLAILNLYYYLFRRIFRSMKENRDGE